MAAAPPALGPKIFGLGFRFNPTPKEAVTYYLPRLISGDPMALHEAVRPVIHRADVYACDPADLARRIRPMPRTGDRFFFAPCNSKKPAVYDANRQCGSWNAQSTVVEIKDGELKKMRYKKRGVFTDWLMDEYSSSSCSGGGKQFVLCKVYVSPRSHPNSAAHRESAACFALPPPPPAPAAPTVVIPHLQPAAPKRSAPPYPKRVRASPPPPQPPPAPPAPTRTPLAAVRMTASLAPPPPPPQPCRAPRCHGSTAPSATPPSPASAPPVLPPVRAHHAALQQDPSPMPTPLAQPKEQAVASASHMPQQAAPPPCPPPPKQVLVQPKQKKILDPFQAEEQAQAAAAPHPPPRPTATPPAVQDKDDDWDDLYKALGIEDATPGLQNEDKTKTKTTGTNFTRHWKWNTDTRSREEDMLLELL